MAEYPNVVTPVEGIIVKKSLVKNLAAILLSPIAFAIGVCLIWAKVTGQNQDSFMVTWKGFFVGIVMVLVAPLFAYQQLRSLWARRRLVIAADRIQLVETQSGTDTVVLQIPYSNVAEMKYEITKTNRQIGIDLKNLQDPETFAPKVNFQHNKHVDGRHFCILGGYSKGPKAISNLMDKAYNEWRERR